MISIFGVLTSVKVLVAMEVPPRILQSRNQRLCSPSLSAYSDMPSVRHETIFSVGARSSQIAVRFRDFPSLARSCGNTHLLRFLMTILLTPRGCEIRTYSVFPTRWKREPIITRTASAIPAHPTLESSECFGHACCRTVASPQAILPLHTLHRYALWLPWDWKS